MLTRVRLRIVIFLTFMLDELNERHQHFRSILYLTHWLLLKIFIYSNRNGFFRFCIFTSNGCLLCRLFDCRRLRPALAFCWYITMLRVCRYLPFSLTRLFLVDPSFRTLLFLLNLLRRFFNRRRVRLFRSALTSKWRLLRSLLITDWAFTFILTRGKLRALLLTTHLGFNLDWRRANLFIFIV